MDDTTDAIKMMVSNLDLSRLQVEMARTITPTSRIAQLTPEEMTVRNYLLLLYGIFERAYLLYTRKWIDKDAWDQFGSWLEVMTSHPMFVDVHQSSIGMYDRPFQDYVTTLLKKKK